MAVTTEYQGSYNGLSFGPETDVTLQKIEGLRSLAVRSGDIPRARARGSWAGQNYMDERVFRVDLEVFAPSRPFGEVVSEVADAFQNRVDPDDQLPFELLLPTWTESRIVMCRPTRAEIPIDQWYQYNRVPIPVEMTANDPNLYSSTLHSGSAGLPSPTAGLTFPVTFPATFGSSSGGSIPVENLGNTVTYPRITITGPVTTPTVQLTATGEYMTVDIILGVSDSLVIDMAEQSVILNGTASRYSDITTGSTWWGIPPGAYSVAVSSRDSAPVAALFTIEWRDAWGFA